MTNRFLISVAAAALIASTGFANAQGAGGGMGQGGGAGGGAAGGSTMQQGGGGSSERGAPSQMNRDSGPSGAGKGAQSDRMEGGKNAQSDRMDGTKGKSAQDTDRGKAGKDMKAEGREGKDKSTVGQSREQGRDDRMAPGQDRDRTKAQQGQDRDRMQQGQDRDRTQQGQDRDRAQQGGQTTTTGQAGAGAKISTEQRTQITNVIKQQNVAPVTNVNFSVSVGTRVPRDVHFHVLPQEVVTIYPQWRGYKFIRVREEIVIIDPNTYEIVEIIRV